jgi:hypothetical protein
MFKKDNATRDTFSLGLGGMTVITSFAAVPAIAHDRLRQVRVGQTQDSRERKWRLWMPRRFRVA